MAIFSGFVVSVYDHVTAKVNTGNVVNIATHNTSLWYGIAGFGFNW